MKSEDAIRGRLDGLHLAYQAIPGNEIDNELNAMIGELAWVLEESA